MFEYRPTRSGSVPRDFLKGWSGYLTTDGYGPYFGMGLEGVTNTACLVHVRRKFAEIVRSAGGDAACEGADSIALEARRRIDRIFRVDSRFDDMGHEQRKRARDRKLRPLMDSFERWARSAILEAVPGLALHRALAYALKYWPYVTNVLEDGRLGLDNNVAESYFGSLKNEWYHRFSFETKAKARMAVIWYIETFYSRTRPHSSVGWRKPAELMDEFFARFDRGLEDVQMAA